MNCSHRRLPNFLLLILFICIPVISLAGAGSDDVAVAPNADLLYASFEAIMFPPVGWYKIHEGVSYSWARSSAASQDGAYSAYCRDGSPGSAQDEYLVTPALDFSYIASPRLGWYEEEANWASRGGTHYIMVSTTSQSDPSAFEVVLEMTPATHNVAGFSGPMQELDLSAYAGESSVYVAFRYVGDDSDYWFVDGVKVFELVGSGGDVSPTSVGPADVSYNDGDAFIPTATVYNNGTESVSFDVTMQIFESGVEVYNEAVNVGNLASDESSVLDFSEFTVAEGHLIELRCTTDMVDDQIPANDVRSTYNTAYTQPHVPMGLLFTNAGCSPCVPANQALDAYIPGQGNDVGLARIHVWWPGADGMYNANTAQASAMVSDYGVSGVPAMFIDGTINVSSSYFASTYDARKLIKSPVNVELVFDDDTDELTVKVNVVEMMRPVANLKLRAYITEGNVYYAGANGETRHHQAMRHIWPDTDGLDVPTTPGTHTFVIDAPLGANWAYDNLRATAYLQDMDSREILQAGTNFLTEIDDPGLSAVGDQMASVYRLNANYPNPFNPSTTISFNLPGNEQVEVAVYALDGSRVATLVSEVMAAGDHQVVWNGKDNSGFGVASGAYFYRLMTPAFSETRVMTLIK